MFFLFYITALWFMGRRTGLPRKKRIAVVIVGVAFIGVYIGAGLLITPSEWSVLLPKLMQSVSAAQ